MSTSPPFAFVTLVTSDHYLPGALVVAAALNEVHASPPVYPDEFDPSQYDRVCLVTPETVDVSTVKHLRGAFDVVIGVEVIEEDNEEGLKLLGRLDLRTVLTKLHVFRLTAYQKIIFLDADILTMRPISHLFRISSSFAAVPDVGWPDIFNSGFLVLEPSEDKFKKVMEVVKSKGSWDGGDQGVLNEWVGQDWERLSFTYNTTPTAVYTYAPAYKRFGSQISNIHFIGPNKPWLQIPFRQPGSSSSTSLPNIIPPQQFAPSPSYTYPALLDRWFAVYDKHYRPPVPPAVSQGDSAVLSASLAPPTEVHRYESVWNSDLRPGIELEATGVGAPLGLEELRRMAVEGVGESESKGEEGVYRSLPLEGRVDLMRPHKPPLMSKERLPRVVKILLPDNPHTPLRSAAPMTTLPTPGPNELPPAPVFRSHSLPPETPTHARVEGLSYITPDHSHLRPTPEFDTSPRPESPARSRSPTHPVSPQRRASPPLLVWNPAVDSPPTAPPPASHFPEETYFPNAWDTRTQEQHVNEDSDGFFRIPPPPQIPEMLIREGHYKAVIGEPIHGEHWHPPQSEEQHRHPQPHQPPHQIQPDQPPQQTQPNQPPQQPSDQPSHYPHSEEQSYHQQQQQPRGYQPAQAHQPHREHQPVDQPSHPQPDRSKVVAVFPWEEKPRHAPERFFPPTDSPPPGHSFIQPQSPALKLDVRPRPTRVFPPATSPSQQGFPRTTTYANAWDAVPSIQRYAARLVRPAPISAPVVESLPGIGRPRKGSGATAGGDEYRSWQDLVEVSSRDADDEDDGDEDEPSPLSGEAESDRGKGIERSTTAKKKTYKGKGVQTVQKETRHVGVQAQSIDRVEGRAARSGSRKTGQRERVVPNQDSSDDDRPSRPPVALPHQHEYVAGGAIRGVQLADLVVEPPSVPSAVPELSPVMESRTIFTGTTAEAVASPPSSLGPTSPPEGVPIVPGPQSTTASAARPVGRKFDPARGVDVFKKGSEEVLARFLRMSSWEDDSSMGTPLA